MNLGKNYVAHDLLLFAPKDLFQYNDDFVIASLQFRDREAEVVKPDTAYRIMTMGGSNCYGDGLDRNDQTFSALLEECLRGHSQSKTVEVLNAGVKGFNLFQLSKLFEHYALAYRPDMLILYININDSMQDFGPYTYKELWQMKQEGRWNEVEDTIARNNPGTPQRSWIDKTQKMLQPFRLYNLLVRKISRSRSEELRPFAEGFETIKEVNPAEDYRENLQTMIRLCKENRIELILADAFKVDYIFGKSYRENIVRAIMKEEAEKNQVPLVLINDDFHKRPDKASLVFAHDTIHINRKGHQAVADSLCSFILEGNYLP
jgi:lysophospholipase L1-like esterase